MEQPITALSALLAPIFASIVFYFFKLRATTERKRLASEVEKLAKERWEASISLGPGNLRDEIETGSETSDTLSPELLNRIEEQILSRLASSPSLTKEDVQNEIDDQLSELREALTRIQSRLPKEGTVDQTANINAALLSERIDQLAKQVENLDKRTLSKWDVALTVGTVITGIVLVVGTTYTVTQIIVTGQ